MASPARSWRFMAQFHASLRVVGTALICGAVVTGCGTAAPKETADAEVSDAAKRNTHDSATPHGNTDGGSLDSGSRDPVTTKDAAPEDASGTAPGACMIPAASCPSGCLDLTARPYNQHRMCIENVPEVVGCLPPSGFIDDPRCARKLVSGQIYRVPYAFLVGPQETPPGPDWISCSSKDDNFVSSTVTPSCDDLEDGGIYDGAI
jgi:hypothetical protein